MAENRPSEGRSRPSEGRSRPSAGRSRPSAGRSRPSAGSIETLGGSIETLRGSIETLRGSIEALRGSIETLRGSTETLHGSIEALRGSIETLRGSRTPSCSTPSSALLARPGVFQLHAASGPAESFPTRRRPCSRRAPGYELADAISRGVEIKWGRSRSFSDASLLISGSATDFANPSPASPKRLTVPRNGPPRAGWNWSR